jgi:cobalt-zinc-cadmium efflux system membrane fusion protein
MKTILTASIVFSLLQAPVLAGPGAHGPNGEHLDAPSGAPNASGLARLPDGSVNVPKVAQRRMAIRTVLAPSSDASVTLELPGRVVADPNASGRVQAIHGGRVEPGPTGLPVVGQSVRQGQTLAFVRHHAEPYALGQQQAQLAELQTQRVIAEQRVRRLEDLEATVPRKDIEAAREQARGLADRERSIRQSLASREALLAPVSGIVARTDLTLGQVVDSREVLAEVVDAARMLVEATSADSALGGRIQAASLDAKPGVALRFRGASRALREGLLPMTFSITPTRAGAALPLAIGEPVTVLVQTRDRIKGIVLPAQALARNPSNEPIVWIKSGEERFYPQPVQFRPINGEQVVVTQGLSADNRVVVQGAALIAQIR